MLRIAGGKFVFLEHVVDPHPTVRQTIQHWISPLWRVLGDGCRPNLEVSCEALNSSEAQELIFGLVDLERNLERFSKCSHSTF